MAINTQKFNKLLDNKFLIIYIFIFFFLSTFYSINFVKSIHSYNIVISIKPNINFGSLDQINFNNNEDTELDILNKNLSLVRYVNDVKNILYVETHEKMQSQIKYNIERFNAIKMNVSNVNEIFFFEVLSIEKDNKIIESKIIKNLHNAFHESFSNNIVGLTNIDLNTVLKDNFIILKSTNEPVHNKIKSIVKLNILFLSFIILIYLINKGVLKFK